jgi:ATP-dependent DNA helicase RecG
MRESQHIEWKENWRDDYLKWICGFANADGGVLIIGRNDKGKTVGVKDVSKLLVDLPNKVRDTLGIMVDVNLVKKSGKELVEIRVEPYPSPISYKGEYHYRSGSTKQELKGSALERFLLKKRGRHWDDAPEPSFTTRSCSTAALELFKQRSMQSGRMERNVLRDSREVILENLELTEKHGLKRAACLLFSDRPEQYMSGAWIKIGFFVTDDNLRYQDEVHGSLFEQVEKTLELLHTKYLKAYISYQGLQRRETFLFPGAALREALLNAVVHKDYSSGIPIQISVYDDKIVFWNPGGLPENWTLERLLGKHPSMPFNPLLANAFFRAGYIEAWGRGIEKINRECREHDIQPPIYDFGMAGLMLTFLSNSAHLSAIVSEQERIAPEITPIATPITTPITTPIIPRNQLVSLILAKPDISQKELANALGMTRDGIKYHLTKMKREGVIRHVGPARGGHWEVLK